MSLGLLDINKDHPWRYDERKECGFRSDKSYSIFLDQ